MFKLYFTDSKAKRVKVVNEPAFAKLREKNGQVVYATGEKKLFIAPWIAREQPFL